MKIIVINGMPRSGKDQFVSFCQNQTYWCKNISTVDFVKAVAQYCGWDGTKTPENRAFLSELKDLLTKWNDVPYKHIEESIKRFEAEAQLYDFSTDDVVVFIHCREPKEIQKFVDRMGAKTLLIRRAAVEDAEQSNHADAEVFNYQYDYEIKNNGTLEELERKAIKFLEELEIPNRFVEVNTKRAKT